MSRETATDRVMAQRARERATRAAGCFEVWPVSHMVAWHASVVGDSANMEGGDTKEEALGRLVLRLQREGA